MRPVRFRIAMLLFVAGGLAMNGCGGRGAGTSAVPPRTEVPTARSVSPASIAVAPMARTPILPPSVMTSLKPAGEIQQLGWTQIPGGGIAVAASPDGSIWVLSSVGTGPDRAIWHYASGSWTNIPGAAMRLAAAPDNSLWVVNSIGGIYHYANGAWTAIAGGASDITVGADGSVYVISNQGGGPFGYGIWHYSGGSWTQMPGAGVRIAASWDTGTYTGVSPGGFWVTNAAEGIYYYNPGSGFAQVPGAAAALAPTKNGGLFVLGVPPSPQGDPIYYDDLSGGGWTQQPGAAVGIATDSVHVYVTGAAGGIYMANVRAQLPGNGAPLTGPQYGPNNAWGPTAVANALQFPVQSGFNGSGITVAIVIDSNIIGGDLGSYLSYFQTPGVSRQIQYKTIDNASTTPGSDQFEATLDMETVAGLAPGAGILLYIIPTLSTQYMNDAYESILNDGAASVVSMSYGGCERPGSVQTTASSIFESAANQGVAFIAASGDQGNECYAAVNTYVQGVQYPASDPNVIGVGGTETRRGPYALTSATAYNDTDTADHTQRATGGGVSTSFGLPSYQSGLPGAASGTYRNVPDIALPANDAAIYLNGAWSDAVGTSWSAPQFAAMLAEVYNYCSAIFMGPVTIPYYVAYEDGYNAFIDVTSGNNDYQSTSPYYAAGPGYDNVSGIGVPLGMPMAQTVCPNRVPVSRVRTARAQRTVSGLPAAHGPVALDATPHVTGLVDRGRRAQAASTRIQIVVRPGASAAAEEQAVIGVLTSSGFTIDRTFANHLVVDAIGPSSAVEQLFATEMHDVAQGPYGSRYAPMTKGTLPGTLSPYVAGVVLDDVVTMAVPHRR